MLRQAEEQGLAPTEPDFLHGLVACGSSGAHAQGAALWARLRQLAADGALPPLSPKAFTAAIGLRAAAADADGAIALLEELEAAHGQPDLRAFNAALRACALASDAPAAKALLARVAEAGLRADSFSYAAAIRSCGSDTPRALSLLRDACTVAGGAPPVAVYGAALECCARGGAWRDALDTLAQMRDAGVPADAGCYGAALHALQSAGEWTHVYEMLYEMRREGVTSAPSLRRDQIALWRRAKRELGLTRATQRTWVPPQVGRGRGRKKA